MAINWFEIVIILLVVVLLFGGGKISALMGDLAAGLKTFKKTMASRDAPDTAAMSTPSPGAEALRPGRDSSSAKSSSASPERRRRRADKARGTL